MDPLNIFLSYVSEDKKLVGDLKRKLEEEYHFKVFVAHDDITPSTQFDDSILETLRNVQLFIPVLTKQFHKSCFTNQEIGFALALKITILPLKIECNPEGFIKNYQALELKELPVTCNTIYSLLLYNSYFAHLKDLAINSLVIALQNSNSYSETNILVKQLTTIPTFSADQLLGIQQALNTNSQVSNQAFEVPGFKRMLNRKYNITFVN